MQRRRKRDVTRGTQNSRNRKSIKRSSINQRDHGNRDWNGQRKKREGSGERGWRGGRSRISAGTNNDENNSNSNNNNIHNSNRNNTKCSHNNNENGTAIRSINRNRIRRKSGSKDVGSGNKKSESPLKRTRFSARNSIKYTGRRGMLAR